MTTVLFDTSAMIRVGKQLRDWERVTGPIARSMGTVPAGLPPNMGDVASECRRLDAGVRALGELIEGFGGFAIALGERVKAADAAGDGDVAEALARIALVHMPMGHTVVAGGMGLDRLKHLWPDVFNALDDIEGAKAADDLVRSLDPSGLKKLDAIAEWRRKHPGRPLPRGLRSLDETIRGAGRVAEWLKHGGVAASVVTRFLRDLMRDDLTLAQKLFRAAEAGAIDIAVGEASSNGIRILLVRAGVTGVRGPVGWLLSGTGAIIAAAGADKVGNVISGQVLLEPNPNSKERMKLPPEIRARIETANGPYRWPEISHPTPEMDRVLDEARTQERRIDDLYSRLHSKEPMDPTEYRRTAYDLVRELDRRITLADRLEALNDAKR